MPLLIITCTRVISKQCPRRKWLVTTRKTRFAESNRTSSSPQGLKFLGDPGMLITTLYPAFSGKTCIATGRSPERQRRVLSRKGTIISSASFGNCFATEAKHEAEQAYRRNVRGTIQGISTPRESEAALARTLPIVHELKRCLAKGTWACSAFPKN